MEKITTTQIAKQLKTSNNVITNACKKCLPNKKITKGKATFFLEEEVAIIVDYLKKNSNRNDLTTYKTGLIGLKTTKDNQLKISKQYNSFKELSLEDKIKITLKQQADIINEMNNENIQLKQENKEIKQHNYKISTALQSFINLSNKEYEEKQDGRNEENKKIYWWNND